MRSDSSTPFCDDRVVVVGSRSFIGRALVAHLTQRGVAVLGLSSRDVDLASPSATERLLDRLRDGDRVVMAAGVAPGTPPGGAELVANAHFAHALRAALAERRAAQLVYLSSDAVYPDTERLLSEASCASGPSVYGVSHRVREAILSDLPDTPVAVLRCTMVYGVEDSHDAYGPNRMARSSVGEGRIDLFGAGEDVRDYLAIDDLVELIARVLEERRFGVFNAVSGEAVAVARLAGWIARATSRAVRIHHLPRRQPPTRRRFDVSRVRQAFPGWAPRSLERGVTELVEQLEGC